MKKKSVLIIAILVVSVSSIFAQTTSKHGEEILPKKGSFGVMADLTPIVRPLVVLNHNESLYSKGLFNNGKTLGLKYFVKDDLALRFKFRFNNVSTTFKALVDDDLESGNVLEPIKLDESLKVKEYNYTFLLGVEKRRGEGRLQGVFGGETGVLFGNGMKMNYTYMNEITDQNLNPTTTDFSDKTNINNITSSGRIKTQNNGYNFSYILRGFVGMEYYFLPKMSLGVEFAWGMDLSSQKDGIYTEEFWDATNSTVNTKDYITRGSTSVGFDNTEAVINFNFYF